MNNKKTFVPAVVILIVAVVGAVGVKTFLGPCVHEDGSFGSCYWAGQAVLGVWLLIFAESLIVAAAALTGKPGEGSGFAAGLYAAMLIGALLGIALPGGLVRLCSMSTMRCISLMRPAMTILFVITAVCSAAGIAVCVRRKSER